MEIKTVALVGNPNSGKSSIFNHLTGLNQQVGNYPGITVDKKSGTMRLDDANVKVIDLPGIYSLYPRSEDERIVYSLMNDRHHADFPDVVMVVADATNLERNLLLFTQLYDLQIPVILVLNMIDLSDREGITIDKAKLSELFCQVPVVSVNARNGQGLHELKAAVSRYQLPKKHVPFLEQGFSSVEATSEEEQIRETEARYRKIRQALRFVVKQTTPRKSSKTLTAQLDKITTHPILGYIIFLGILFLMFQAVYSLAEVPMNLIDQVFLTFSQWTAEKLPAGVFTNLLAEGIIPGLGGVVIFVPQIVLLFTFIVILEETGYMARVVFILDRLMRPFGLSGKSVVPLISGVACAIPAIMATRTIDQWKDRLVTIFVTPLMSCSARLPVYTLLITLVIPDREVWGIFNLKGLVLLAMYVLGLLAALLTALIVKLLVSQKTKSFLVMELPSYKAPRWKNVMITLWEKTRVFVFEAGKVIMAISIILWVLASYGPGNKMEEAVAAIEKPATDSGTDREDYEKRVASVSLENSWIGLLGKTIEPAIEPLGYNWKIGISLITSFAAREVFVGSLATIYSVGEDFEADNTLISRMKGEVDPDTGKPVYTLATGLSLMIFYAFAMQCMSTLAIVLRETKSWKWPLYQTLFMTMLAYFSALLIYQILS